MARNKQKYFCIYYDPADDIVYIGAVSRMMQLYNGEIGYKEFANKRIAQTTLSIDDDDALIPHNGSFVRYDDSGFIDWDHTQDRFRELLEHAPTWGGKIADPITRRRIDTHRFRLSWEDYPGVTQRVVNYILNGERPDNVKTSRAMSLVKRDE